MFLVQMYVIVPLWAVFVSLICGLDCGAQWRSHIGLRRAIATHNFLVSFEIGKGNLKFVIGILVLHLLPSTSIFPCLPFVYPFFSWVKDITFKAHKANFVFYCYPKHNPSCFTILTWAHFCILLLSCVLTFLWLE